MINDSDLICGTIFLLQIIYQFVIMWLTHEEKKSIKSESSYRIKICLVTFQINLLPTVNFHVRPKHKYYFKMFLGERCSFIYH